MASRYDDVLFPPRRVFAPDMPVGPDVVPLCRADAVSSDDSA